MPSELTAERERLLRHMVTGKIRLYPSEAEELCQEIDRLRLELDGERKARELLNAGMGSVCEGRDAMKLELRDLRAALAALTACVSCFLERPDNAATRAELSLRLARWHADRDKYGVRYWDEKIAALAAQDAELARLREAAKPFADKAQSLCFFLNPVGQRDDCPIPNSDGLTLGHYRALLAALLPPTPKEG